MLLEPLHSSQWLRESGTDDGQLNDQKFNAPEGTGLRLERFPQHESHEAAQNVPETSLIAGMGVPSPAVTELPAFVSNWRLSAPAYCLYRMPISTVHAKPMTLCPDSLISRGDKSSLMIY